MPNTERDLRKRLLHLLPVRVVKEHFDQTGSFEDISEHLSALPTRTLMGFYFDNFNLSRQNIYLFELNKNFSRNSINQALPLTIHHEVSRGGMWYFSCYAKTEFSVYLDNPVALEALIFYQPIHITISGRKIAIAFTKLEKNVNSYFPQDRSARRSTVKNDQDILLKEILAHLSQTYSVSTLDFNKGIKGLWANDDIDCFKIQFKNPHSVRVETMDGTLTFKTKYPLEYAEIVGRPMGSAQWKYLRGDDYLCDTFTADPSKGEISITKFPENNNQIANVINKILASN